MEFYNKENNLSFSQSPIEKKNSFNYSKMLIDTNSNKSFINNSKLNNISISEFQTYDKSFNKFFSDISKKSEKDFFEPSSFLLNQPKKKINSKLNLKNINNEGIKLLFINNNIKPEYLNKYSTDPKKLIDLYYNKEKNLNERYFCLKKKKSLLNSVKKKFSSVIFFYDEKTNKKYCFPLFKDIDLGINTLWDDNLKYKLCDNDVNTKKEIIKKEYDNNMHFLSEGINDNQNK